MAITFVNKGTSANGIGAITPALPASILANDLLLLFEQTSNQGPSAPAGWSTTFITPFGTSSGTGTGTANTAGSTSINVWYKIATGSDSAPSVADSGDHQYAVVVAYRGVNTLSPFGQFAISQDAAATTALSWPSIDAGHGNLILNIVGLGLDAASTTTTTGYANANLSSITERLDETVTTGTGGGVAMCEGISGVDGAIGATTATSTSCTHALITLELHAGPPTPSSPGATSITTTTATPQVTLTY